MPDPGAPARPGGHPAQQNPPGTRKDNAGHRLNIRSITVLALPGLALKRPPAIS